MFVERHHCDAGFFQSGAFHLIEPFLQWSAVVGAVDVPVLLIEGSESPPIVAAIHEALAARLPRAERTMIGGAGHMAPLTHPKQVGSEVLRFLEWA